MTNIFHLIWFQGFQNLPKELSGVPKLWGRLNPNYTVMQWCGEKLSHFVALNYPQFCDFYGSLGEGQPENVMIVKRCDFARLLLLHRYGGWYFDVDCLPVLPMSYLLDSGQVHHRNTPFSYSRDSSHPTVLGTDPAPLAVDFGSYEMVMSREHLPNPALGGYPVSNTVIYAKAGSPLLMEMIEGCVSRAGEKVLDFAGPIGLGRWVRERADTLKGKLLVLPPFYFLWQTHDQGTPWEGTICCHLNRLDWTDKTKEVPWDV